MTSPTRNQALQILTRAIEGALAADETPALTAFQIACVVYDTLGVQGLRLTYMKPDDLPALRGHLDQLLTSLGKPKQP